MEIKQDAIAEGAEVVGYEALIAITQKSSNIPQNDIISIKTTFTGREIYETMV